jgi:transposase
MEFITGRSRNQIALLPDSIEEYVGEDNAVRVIGAYINGLDMSGLKFSRPQLRSTGRPGYDPKDLLKLYVYGYMNRVRSPRRSGWETQRKVEVMRLMGKLSTVNKLSKWKIKRSADFTD